jgi:hypothetical protein
VILQSIPFKQYHYLFLAFVAVYTSKTIRERGKDLALDV